MDELVFSSGLGDDADDKDTYQAVRQTRAGWAGFLFLITFFAWDGADCPQYLHLNVILLISIAPAGKAMELGWRWWRR